MKPITLLLSLLFLSTSANCSQCYGETHQGRVEGAVQLPQSGPNFKAYSTVGWWLGRTYVHSEVADVLLETFAQLAKSHPELKFTYAETGWPQGGPFQPHKTHQNGLSVDLMVPVLDDKQQSVFLPLDVSNQFGYQLEFDQRGQSAEFNIDFEALGLLIKTIHQQSEQQDVAINRVILAPDLQPHLFTSSHGEFLQQHVEFNQRQAWVRHDEHIHIDFKVPCLSLNQYKKP